MKLDIPAPAVAQAATDPGWAVAQTAQQDRDENFKDTQPFLPDDDFKDTDLTPSNERWADTVADPLE